MICPSATHKLLSSDQTPSVLGALVPLWADSQEPQRSTQAWLAEYLQLMEMLSLVLNTD